MKTCVHCGGDIEIRNPSGFCDHLQYPDYCSICSAEPRYDFTARWIMTQAIPGLQLGGFRTLPEYVKVADVLRRQLGPVKKALISALGIYVLKNAAHVHIKGEAHCTRCEIEQSIRLIEEMHI